MPIWILRYNYKIRFSIFWAVLDVFALKVKKNGDMTKKNFVLKNSYRLSKNAKFYPDFKSYKFNAKKYIQKKLYAKLFDAHL